ncbi:hypothetical protein O5D80_006876 [Batrachochytrium dendrobatidis]|nr:hypothetical protein O5D80_006876 [Batrachochytrium dendrobatidis]
MGHSDNELWQTVTYFATLSIVLYICLVYTTKFARHNTFSTTSLIDPSELTDADLDISLQPVSPTLLQCIRISHATRYFEFPFEYARALDIHTLKHMGMPNSILYKALVALFSISESSSETIEDALCKWMDVGDLLVREITERPLYMERTRQALDAIKECLKDMKGVSNDDKVYMMCGFVVDPVLIINSFGWRRLVSQEVNALVVTWRAIGLYLEIKDMPLTMAAMMEFMKSYESKNIAYSDQGKQLFEAAISLWTKSVPLIWVSLIDPFLMVLLPKPFLNAVGGQEPAQELVMTVSAGLAVRSWWIRWLELSKGAALHRTPRKTQGGVYFPANGVFKDSTYTKNGYTIAQLTNKLLG